MKKIVRAVLFLAALALSTATWAQAGCPPGQYPVAGQGWNYCAPVPGYQDPGGQANQPRAENRWLSLAIDASKAALGAAVSTVSQKEAEREAIAECMRQGGRACKVDITQVNGCVAMVTGKSYLNTRGGASKDEAEQKSMMDCQSSDTECKVYYSACEIPGASR